MIWWIVGGIAVLWFILGIVYEPNAPYWDDGSGRDNWSA